MGLGAFSKTVRHHGGVWGCLKSLHFRDSLKHGKLVGTDVYGNRYYENNNYFVTRNRWVEFPDHVGYNYDASQVPAEWFGWLHHRTDLPPDQEPFRPKYHWILPHEENMSGTPLEYVPYTTTRPRIESWVPPRVQDKLGKQPPSDSESDSSKGCGERKTEESPPKCEEEKKKSPPPCHKEEIPPKCEKEEVKKECDERAEEKTRPACEKPARAFH